MKTIIDSIHTTIAAAAAKKVVTLTGEGPWSGTAESEIVHGTDGRNEINAQGGDNEVYAAGGNDTVIVHDGNDLVDGGDGDDRIESSGGNDTLLGGNGNDRFIVSAHATATAWQSVDGGANDDRAELYGARFRSSADLRGGSGVDTLAISSVTLSEFTATSELASWERLQSNGHGHGRVSGTGERDTLDFDGLTLVDDKGAALTSAALGLRIDVHGGDDTVYGTMGRDEIYGGAGDDYLVGMAGDDRIEGGDDHDTLEGGDGDDTLNGNGDDDTLYGDAGGDTLDGGNGDDKVDGGDGNDKISDAGGLNILDGGAGDDTITSNNYGIEYNSVNVGGDMIFGGAGKDTVKVSGGSWIVSVDGGEGEDTLEVSHAFFHELTTKASGIEKLSVTGDISGTKGANLLDISGTEIVGTRANGAVRILGGWGDDTIVGSAGTDEIYGEYDHDLIEGGAGDDILDGGWGIIVKDATGKDVVQSTGDQDIVSYAHAAAGVTVDLSIREQQDTGAAGKDTLTGFEGVRGSAFADVLKGSAGSDLLQGGAGNDVLYGGLGGDRIEGGDGDDVIHGGGRHGDTHYGSAQPPATAYNPEVLIGGAGADSYVFADRHAWGNWTYDTVIYYRPGPGQNGNVGEDYFYTPQGMATPTQVEFVAHEGDRLVLAGHGNGIAKVASFDPDVVGTAISYAIVGDHTEVYLAGLTYFSNLPGGSFTTGVVGKLVLSSKVDLRQEAPGSTSYVGLGIVEGGAGNDILTGSAGHDSLYGLGGDDVLEGGAGNDWINGGAGVDTASYASATAGVTVTLQNQADDMATVGVDQDTGGAGFDLLKGIENLTGSAFADTLTGDANRNVIRGGAGDDVLTGGAGRDDLDGGAGADTYLYRSMADMAATVGGAASAEFIRMEGGDRIDVSAFVQSYTFLYGEAFSGSGAQEARTEQRDGNTVLMFDSNGDGAADGYITIEGPVSLTYDDAGVFRLSTLNRVEGDARANKLTGTAKGDHILGRMGNDQLRGLDGDDVIEGEDGNDLLDGGVGADRMEGGIGNDTYYVDQFGDLAVELAGEGVDKVVSTMTAYALAANVEQLVLGEGALAGTGNALDNVMTGNGYANALSGLDGNDRLSGGGGNDGLFGGNGNDSLFGEEGDDKLFGEDGADKLDGGLGADVIEGAAGDDQLLGGGHDDYLAGGDGNDRLDGGAGIDFMEGGFGNDIYYVDTGFDQVIEGANGGTDTVYAATAYTLTANVEHLRLADGIVRGTGNALSNAIYGGGAANLLQGEGGNDTLYGNDGDDRLEGGEGADTLDGGAGIDTLVGGRGNDGYRVDNNADVVVEEADGGVDKVTSSVNYALGDHVEQLTLTGMAVRGTGNTLNNDIRGNVVDNQLRGGDGNDAIYGLEGRDSLLGEAGDDRLAGGEGEDYLAGGDGKDALDGGADADVLEGGAGDDKLNGGLGDDLLEGGDGADVLDGSLGADEMRGGDGGDTYHVDQAGDVVVEDGASGIDQVNARIDYTLGAGIERLALVGNAKTGTGNALDNVISATQAGGTLYGLAGNDTLNGGAGADRLDGGSGNDRMAGGKGDDAYVVDSILDVVVEGAGAGIDTVQAYATWTMNANVENVDVMVVTGGVIRGNASDNAIRGNDGRDYLWGFGGNDTLTGGKGGDMLNGGAGLDWLAGGEGDDTFEFLLASDAQGDVIADFAKSDRIDLSGIDAITTAKGNNAFAWIGAAAFSGTAGELRVEVDAGGVSHVYGDVNGDGLADFDLSVVSIASLAVTDFLL